MDTECYFFGLSQLWAPRDFWNPWKDIKEVRDVNFEVTKILFYKYLTISNESSFDTVRVAQPQRKMRLKGKERHAEVARRWVADLTEYHPNNEITVVLNVNAFRYVIPAVDPEQEDLGNIVALFRLYYNLQPSGKWKSLNNFFKNILCI